MKKQLLLALASLFLAALSMGCADDGATGPTEIDELNNPDGTEQMLTVTMTAPEGAMVNFIVDGTVLRECLGVNTCDLAYDPTAPVEVEIDCPSHIFIPKVIDGKAIEVTWTDNEWALAPDGIYDDGDGTTFRLKTLIDDGVILINGFTIPVEVVGNTFFGEGDAGAFFGGTISDDLQTIELDTRTVTGVEMSFTLHLTN